MAHNGYDINYYEQNAKSSEAKRSILGLINSVTKYDGVVWQNKYEYYDGKELVDIIQNKRDYKEFISALKKTEGEIYSKVGASAGIPIRAFFRNECSEIVQNYGGFIDKMTVNKS